MAKSTGKTKPGRVGAKAIEVDRIAKAGTASAHTASDLPMGATIGSDDEEVQLCERAGAIPPVHPFEYLARLCESSTAISPVLEAIATNTDGHDYQLQPVFGADLSDEDIEVTEVAWVPLTELHSRLAYADERKLAELASQMIAEMPRTEIRQEQRPKEPDAG